MKSLATSSSTDSRMKISALFDEYADKMTQIQLYQRVVKKNAETERQLLNEYSDSLKAHPELKEYSSTIDNMMFRSATSGEGIVFGQ